MLKKITLIAACFFTAALYGQGEVTFEELNQDSGKVLNGIDGSLNTAIESLNFPVFWDTSFGGFWSSGWAVSSKLDSATANSDYASQLYLAKPKYGFNNSKAFAVGQSGSFFYSEKGIAITEFYISNSVYTYNSMKLGDAFAKKFGGNSGRDQDSLICVIKSYFNGNLTLTQRIALADFRFADSAQDYILKDWIAVNPGICDSVVFGMESSDNSSWGMNTPSFFVLDNVKYDRVENTVANSIATISVYPNPVQNRMYLQTPDKIQSAHICNLSGSLVYNVSPTEKESKVVAVAQLQPGVYILRAVTANGTVSARFVKQ